MQKHLWTTYHPNPVRTGHFLSQPQTTKRLSQVMLPSSARMGAGYCINRGGMIGCMRELFLHGCITTRRFRITRCLHVFCMIRMYPQSFSRQDSDDFIQSIPMRIFLCITIGAANAYHKRVCHGTSLHALRSRDAPQNHRGKAPQGVSRNECINGGCFTLLCL